MASLSPTQQKEQYSIAFAHAVVATAGYAFQATIVDDDSVDITIRSRRGDGAWIKPQLDIQAKCTSSPNYAPTGNLSFALPVKNYNDLRPPTLDVKVPRLLLVVVVPLHPPDWIATAPDALSLQFRGHWVSLAGRSAISNTTSVAVELPATNRWDPATVEHLMVEASHGRI